MSETAEKPAPAPAAGGGNKNLLLLMVLVFNVIIAGGLGYLVISGRSKPVETPKHENATGKAAAAGEGEGEGEEPETKDGKPASKFGPLIEVGTFVANLANSGTTQGRYAKVTLSVETTNEEAKTQVEAALVPIRAEALMYFSNARPEDMVGQEKIRALADELLKRFNALVGKKTIKRVFFSELVVQ